MNDGLLVFLIVILIFYLYAKLYYYKHPYRIKYLLQKMYGEDIKDKDLNIDVENIIINDTSITTDITLFNQNNGNIIKKESVEFLIRDSCPTKYDILLRKVSDSDKIFLQDKKYCIDLNK